MRTLRHFPNLFRHLRLSALGVNRRAHAAAGFLVAFVVVGVAVLVMQQGSTRALRAVAEEATPAVVALERLAARAARMQSAALSYRLARASPSGGAADLARARQAYRTARADFEVLLAAYAGHPEKAAIPFEQRLSRRLRADRLRVLGARLVRAGDALAELSNGADEAAARQAWGGLERAAGGFMRASRDAAAGERATLNTARRAAERQATWLQALGVGAALGALALALLFAYRLHRAVAGLTRTVRELDAARPEVAAAHLRALGRPRHEVGLLAAAFGELLGRFGEINRDLEHAATHDTLTGAANRTLLVRRLGALLNEPGRRFALLFIDLDRFKAVNDSLGHAVGDALLVAVSRRLRQNVRADELVARLGGDEFVVLLTGVASLEAPRRIAERLLADLERPFSIGGHEIYVSGSVGLVSGGPDSSYGLPEEVLHEADLAMYEAKAQGAGQYRVFEAALQTAGAARKGLSAELRGATERGELEVYYQPVVALGDGTVVGVEALVRWRHPVAGVLLPGAFIPLAEEAGLLADLDRWVLRTACAQVARWRSAAQPLTLSVNLSSQGLERGDLLEVLKDTLLATGFAPGDLHLEVAETTLLRATPTAMANLKGLHELGVGLDVDDFGTGYASLGLIQRCAATTLKLDPSLVRGVSETGTELIRNFLGLARSLNLRVVAEGVETREQLGGLRASGCEYAQGYLFAAALEAPAVETLLGAPRTWLHGEFGPS